MILRRVLRQLLLARLLYGRRQRQRGWYGMGRGYRTSPFGFGRPRGRSQIRVGGCCLPIPLGILATAAVSLQAGRRARRRS